MWNRCMDMRMVYRNEANIAGLMDSASRGIGIVAVRWSMFDLWKSQG